MFLVLAVFGLIRNGLIISILRLFRTYLATLSLKETENMNPHKFSVFFCIKKNYQSKKKEKLFVEKEHYKFHSN